MKKNIVLLLLLLISSASFAQIIYAEEQAVYDGVKKIEVEGSFCDVEIIGGVGNEVQFKGEIKGISGRNKKFTIHHKLNGSTLRVWVDSPNSSWGNIQGMLTFKVPEKIELDVRNSSGDVFCENINADLIKLKASSGDIALKQIKGNVQLLTSSGEIEVNEIVGNVVTLSSSGDQELKNITGNVESKATSGNIELKDIQGEVVSRTSSGDLEIERLHGSLKNVSSSGSVDLNNSKAILHLTASSGNIQAHNLILLGESFFSATSGNVFIELANDFEQLSFDLSASSGNLKVKKRKADDKLYVKKGEIWIHGKTSSGNQTYQ